MVPPGTKEQLKLTEAELVTLGGGR